MPITAADERHCASQETANNEAVVESGPNRFRWSARRQRQSLGGEQTLKQQRAETHPQTQGKLEQGALQTGRAAHPLMRDRQIGNYVNHIAMHR